MYFETKCKISQATMGEIKKLKLEFFWGDFALFHSMLEYTVLGYLIVHFQHVLLQKPPKWRRFFASYIAAQAPPCSSHIFTRVWEFHWSMLRNTVSTTILNCRSIWSAPGTSTPTYLVMYAFRYLTKPKVFIFICGKTFSTGLSCAANLFEDGASQKSQKVLCNFRSEDHDVTVVTVHFFFHFVATLGWTFCHNENDVRLVPVRMKWFFCQNRKGCSFFF